MWCGVSWAVAAIVAGPRCTARRGRRGWSRSNVWYARNSHYHKSVLLRYQRLTEVMHSQTPVRAAEHKP